MADALLIRGATIYDGTGAPGVVRGDVTVTGGRIDGVGPRLERPSGARVIDADGLALAPGLHRPALPRRLHPAGLSRRDQLAQPGRHERGHRQLRVLAGALSMDPSSRANGRR